MHTINQNPTTEAVGVKWQHIDENFTELHAVAGGSNWYQKDMICCGDSVTDNNVYQETIKDLLGLNSITTHAQGGMGIVQIVDGNVGTSFPALQASDLVGKEILTFFGGLNNRDTLIGNVTDMYPTQNTISGMINYVIQKIETLKTAANNRTMRVVFILPHLVGKYRWLDVDGLGEYPVGSGQTLETICTAIKNVCGRHGVPVVDLFHESGINKYNWDIYTVNSPSGGGGTYPANNDNVHLNAEGGGLIGRCIAGKIKQI